MTVAQTVALLIDRLNLAFLRGGAEVNLQLELGQDDETSRTEIRRNVGLLLMNSNSPQFRVKMFGVAGVLIIAHLPNDNAAFDIFLEAEEEGVLRGTWNENTPDDVSQLTAFLSHTLLLRALGLGVEYREASRQIAGVIKDGRAYPFNVTTSDGTIAFPARTTLDRLNAAASRYNRARSYLRYPGDLLISADTVLIGKRPFHPDHLCALAGSEIDLDHAAAALASAAESLGIDYAAALNLLTALPPSIAAALCDESDLNAAVDALGHQFL